MHLSSFLRDPANGCCYKRFTPSKNCQAVELMKENRKILIFFLLAIMSLSSGCAQIRAYRERDADAELTPVPNSLPYLPRLQEGQYGSWTVK
jgi:hypothetical protein